MRVRRERSTLPATVSSIFNGGSMKTSATPRAKQLVADRALVLSLLISVVLQYTPWLKYIAYPLRLLVTFIHEGCHALATIATSGTVHSISIMPNGSGLTETHGGFSPLIASAGYLGTTLYGALMLWLLRRGVSGHKLIGATAAAVGLATLPSIRDPFSLLCGLLITVGLIGLASKLPRDASAWLASFIGAQFVMNALIDVKTLFEISLTSSTPTDAQNMAAFTLIPAIVWATLWLLLSLWINWKLVFRPALFRK